MSSTNKTSLGLNLWEASDKPVRQDFVNDNTIIDEKITKINSNLDNVNSNLDNVNSNLSNKADKSDLDNILPSKTYSTTNGSFTSLDDLYATQIAFIYIGDDGSAKTPTGKDGLLLVFNHPSTVIQQFFDWNLGFKRRIWWNGVWGAWS
ncbi:MAG: hypothetical protein E7249_06010 [Paenibacillaceae bacterium]|nr:hypothetical protein [Paenibacillaceae bacterium]